MAASNRAARLTKLVADLKKRYKPTPPAARPLFETLLYATLAENSPFEAADQAMSELEKHYFDWNEVRVSSRPELAERLKTLNDPTDASDRLKRTLQSIFESIYAFDLEALKKQNLGQAVKQITAYDGVTPFVVAFATQHGLGGHSIAVNGGVLLALEVIEIVTPAEAKKCTVPGLERAVPKNKGAEAQAALHAMGVEVSKNPYGAAAKKLLLDIDPSCKDRLPKKPAPPAAKESRAPKKKAAPPKSGSPATKPAAATAKPAAKTPPTAKAASVKPAAKKKSAPSKPAPAKKKAAKAKTSTKKAATKSKPAKKPATKPGVKKAKSKTARRKPK